MITYEYKNIKNCDQKKFIENGHTMFEVDVLQRLKRLAYLEVEHKKLVSTLSHLYQQNMCSVAGDEEIEKVINVTSKYVG